MSSYLWSSAIEETAWPITMFQNFTLGNWISLYSSKPFGWEACCFWFWHNVEWVGYLPPYITYLFFIKHSDKVLLNYHVLFMVFHMKMSWRENSISLGHLQSNRLSVLGGKKKVKKSMTYSCQNRRLLKAESKNEKRRKGIERVHFSFLLCLALWCAFFFFCDKVICAVLYLGCPSRSVHDKLQKHGCFLSQKQSLYSKFVHLLFW